MSEHPDLHLIADVKLPQSAFERAGTSVAARVVVIDKVSDKDAAIPSTRIIDLSGAKDINEFFDRLENIDLPERKVIEQHAGQPSQKAKQHRPRQKSPISTQSRLKSWRVKPR